MFDRVTGEPIWPIVETPVLQSDVPGEADVADAADSEQARAVRAAGARRGGPHRLHAGDQGLGAEARARRCRMGPYYIPAAVGDGTAPSGLTCSWYAPGASGGVNIDGGAAVDPETGMIYVGCADGPEHDRSSRRIRARSSATAHRTTAAASSARCRRRRATSRRDGRERRRRRRGGANNDRRRVDPQAEGARRHHGVQHEHRRQGVVDAERRPAPAGRRRNDPLFAGVTLPPAAPGRGQAQIITTKTLRHLRHRPRRRAAERQAAALRGGQGDGQAGWRGERSRRARARCR